MKQATVTVKLDKNMEVIRTNVTPIEVLLLTAEHHSNAGGSPIVVHPGTISEVQDPDGFTEVEVEEEQERDVEKTFREGTPPADLKRMVREKHKVKVKKQQPKFRARSVDDEINRLRGRYRENKIDTILTKVRDLPTEDFDDAIKKGINIVLPSGKLAESRS